MQSKSKRVFYFAPAATQALTHRYGSNFYVGASSHKVFGIATALRSAKKYPVICSSVLSTGAPRDIRLVRYHRAGDAVYAKIFALGFGPIHRIVSAFSYLFYVLFHVGLRDRIILYNFFPEYILLALYRWFVGQPVILDIEDAPRRDEGGLRGIVGRIAYKALRALSSDVCLAASISAIKGLSFVTVLPVYGVSSYFGVGSGERFNAEKVQILYGGEIIPETGLNLFRSAVQLLLSRFDVAARFVVTGRFNPRDFTELQSAGKDVGVEIVLHEKMSANNYQALLSQIDVGLCLKLPSSAMGATTFPSKVVEYASQGLLVCSTAVSDIPLLFNSNNACLLRGEAPEELAQYIADICQNRAVWRQRALEGQRHITSVLSRQVVGARLDQILSFKEGNLPHGAVRL